MHYTLSSNDVTPYSKGWGHIGIINNKSSINVSQIPLTTRITAAVSTQNTFLKKIMRYGSQPILPDWMKDLPDEERIFAESINRISQEQRINANWDSAVSILENWHTSTPVHYVDKKMESIASARNRRAILTATIEDDYIPNQIQNLLYDHKKYSPQVINQLDNIFRSAENSPEVKNANSKKSKNIKMLFKCIELNIELLNNYGTNADSGDTYRFLQFSLHNLWAIANALSNPQSKNEVNHYKAHLQHNKWNEKKIKPIKNYINKNKKIIENYIKIEYPEWIKNNITAEEKIIIINPDEAKIFSIENILNKKHLEFIKDKSISCRFQFDTSGLSDNEVTEFVLSAAETEDFIKFKDKILIFQNKIDNQNNASRLFQIHLKKLSKTPLYFQKYELIQSIINEQIKVLTPIPESNREKKKLIVALINLAIKPPIHFAIEQATLIYAYHLLAKFSFEHFSDFDINKIFHADYIYHYQDQNGQDEFATTTLAEYLCISTKFQNIAISQQKTINMLWPQEFSHDQIAFLEKKSKMVYVFSQKLRLSHQLAQLKQDLSIAMPSFFTRLENVLLDLCKKNAINDCLLSDNFIFSYAAETPNMEIQAALKFSYPIQKKQFTIAEILIGRQRDWEAKNYNYNKKIVTDGPNTIPRKKINAFANSLHDFATQDIFLNSLQEQKKDILLKKHYNQYINLLLVHANWVSHRIHQLSQSPLILIYTSNPPPSSLHQFKNEKNNHQRRFIFRLDYLTPTINLSQPIQTMSLVSGKIHRFDSFVDMWRQLEENEVLGQHFKTHLPVDFGDDFSVLKVIPRPLGDNSFERLVEWQIKNIDKIIKSQAETWSFEMLERLAGVSFVFSLPAMALAPFEEFAFDALLLAGPKLLQAAISDTQQEQEELLKQAVVQLAIEATTQIAAQGISQFITNSIKTIAKNPKVRLEINTNILNTDDRVFSDMHPDIHMHCSKRKKRGIWDAFCSFKRKTRAPQESTSVQLEPIRFQEPLRILGEQSSAELPADIQNLVSEMRREPRFAEIIKHPNEQCINMVSLIENFIKLKNSDAHITYRGILIWDDVSEIGIPFPQNHFVVVYKKNEVSYVFDLTAAQFADKGLPELNEALTMSENAWIEKYQSAAKNKIIKYKDFNNWLSAETNFGGASILFDATHYIEGAVLLSVPQELAHSVTHFV